MTTSTTFGVRDHARAQAGRVARSMRTVPAPGGMVWDEVLDGGRSTAKALARGTRIRLTDVEGDACVQLLLFNALNTAERLNVADTAKVQWQAYLSTGSLLLTDLGRVLATVVDDGSGHHDLFCGADPVDTRRLLMLAAARVGLGLRDVHPCVNLLKGVRVANGDRLAFTGGAGGGAHVELRLELPALVVLANSAHVLDDRDPAPCTPVYVEAWPGEPAGADDPFRSATPEAERAFENTDELLLGHP